ncbi:MAG: hypothetical protein ACLSAF_03920 [Intestinimonas sp.]
MKDFFRNNGALILVIAVLLAAITAVSSYVLQGCPTPGQRTGGDHHPHPQWDLLLRRLGGGDL